MKRILAAILAISLSLGMCSSFTSCGSKVDALKLGEWLKMINQSFGMQSFVEEKPYIASISTSNPYFADVQMACEWDIIDKTQQNISMENPVKYKDALVMLINAGTFVSNTATEKEKIAYAQKHFDKSIKGSTFGLEKLIVPQDAYALLLEAQEKWANRTFETNVSQIEYKDDVKDLSLSDLNISSTLDDQILINGSVNTGLNVGDTVILPSSDSLLEKKAVKIKNIQVEDGKTVITTHDKIDLEDFAEDIFIQETTVPNLMQCEVYDGNGNLVNAYKELNYKGSDENKFMPLSTSTSTQEIAFEKSNTSFEFSEGEYSVKVEMGSNGVSAEATAPLGKGKQTAKLALNNLKITSEIEFGPFKKTHALLKLDYKSSASYEVTRSFEKKITFAPYNNGNRKLLTNLTRDIKDFEFKDVKKGKGAKTIKICQFAFPSGTVGIIYLDILAKIAVDGSLYLECTESGSKGVEFRNNTARAINHVTKSSEVAIKAKIEGTVILQPRYAILGKTIIGIYAEVGLGGSFESTMQLVDNENHLIDKVDIGNLPADALSALSQSTTQGDTLTIKELAESKGCIYEPKQSTVELHIDMCTDIKIYFILRLGITKESVVGDIARLTKIKLEWEIFNDKNAVIANLHIDNDDPIRFMWIPSNLCNKDYNPFDSSKSEVPEKKTPNDTILKGEYFALSDMRLHIEINKSKAIKLVQIPKQYDVSDVMYKTNDANIATVDENGIVTALSDGNVLITVATKDGKYEIECAIVVFANQAIFNPLGLKNNSIVRS